MVSYTAKKNKSVLLLSNYHHNDSISDLHKQNPQFILDYNRHKCGVDILDQMLKGYRPNRATRRWPCVLSFDLIVSTFVYYELTTRHLLPVDIGFVLSIHNLKSLFIFYGHIFGSEGVHNKHISIYIYM